MHEIRTRPAALPPTAEPSIPTVAIPWLAGYAGEASGPVFRNPYGGRTQEEPTVEAAERLLAASDIDEDAQQPRQRPGLRTRR